MRKILSFASLSFHEKGSYLPKGIAGIYAIEDENSSDFYLVSTETCTDLHYFHTERDIVCIKRIGHNVDIRYLFLEKPDPFKMFLDVNGYPRLVHDYNSRRSHEEIKAKMGFETGLDLSQGGAIISGNFLGIVCRDEIVCVKRCSFFSKKERIDCFFPRKEFGNRWISQETELILNYHGITVKDYKEIR